MRNRVRVLGFLDAEGKIEPLVRSGRWPHRELGTDVISYLQARLPRLRQLTWYGPDGAIAPAALSAAGVHDERDRDGHGGIAIDLAECEGSRFYATAPMRPLRITEVPDGRPPSLGAYRVDANERLIQAFWKEKTTGGEHGAPPQTDEEITYKLFDRAWRPMRCVPCTTQGTTSFNRAEFSWFEIRGPKGILFVGLAVLNEHVSWATGGNTAVTILILGPDQRRFSRSWVELDSWGA